jgi:hypothetical protein
MVCGINGLGHGVVADESQVSMANRTQTTSAAVPGEFGVIRAPGTFEHIVRPRRQLVFRSRASG